RAAEDDLDAQRAVVRQAVKTGTPAVAAALRASPRSPVGRATREAVKDKSGADRPAAGPGASGPARQGEDTETGFSSFGPGDPAVGRFPPPARSARLAGNRHRGPLRRRYVGRFRLVGHLHLSLFGLDGKPRDRKST